VTSTPPRVPASHDYPWRRYWHPAGAEVYIDDQGYLIDAEGFGRYLNPEMRRLEELDDEPCLILLGEPGMGKSRTLRQTHERLSQAGETVRLILLGRITDTPALASDLFEHTAFKAWRRGDGPLFLLLDALDEGLDKISSLHHWLVEQFEKRTTEAERQRFRLRVSCRTARWPSSINETLLQLWPTTAVRQLAPLTRGDIAAAAETEGLAGLLDAVDRAGAGPLAAKPITLRMLLDMYRRSADLPRSQVETYEQGCLALCEDSNLERSEAGTTGSLSASQRCELGSRVAAAMLLSNRRFIRLDAPQMAGQDEVTPQELVTTFGEYPSATGFHERDVEDLLRFTSLFTGAGAGRMEWAHQSYAEFLAARYVDGRLNERRRRLALLRDPSDTDGIVVPALQGVATWLGALDRSVFDALLRKQPELLLGSDVGIADEDRKRALVEALLSLTGSGELHFWWHVDYRQYRRLDFPGLDQVLRPFISDRQQGFGARETAISLARACNRRDLLEDLTRLALDVTDDRDLRVGAIAAVRDIAKGSSGSGDVQALRQLLPTEGSDPTAHKLGAAAVGALWPDSLSADELFEAVESADAAGHLAPYASFLYRAAEGLRPADLPRALGWLGFRGQGEWSQSEYHLGSFAVGIVERAWDELTAPGVADSLANAVVAMTRKAYRPFTHSGAEEFQKRYRENKEKRRRLVDAIAKQAPRELAHRMILGPLGGSVFREDAAWLTERLGAATTESERAILASFIGWVFDPSDEKMCERVHHLMQSEPLLTAAMQLILGPIALDSAEAESMKIHHEASLHHAALEKRERQRKEDLASRAPMVNQRIESLLGKSEAGQAEVWWKINYLLGFGEDPGSDYSEFQGDPVAAPGWTSASLDRRRRIVAAAHRFLLQAAPRTKEWITQPRHRRARRPRAAYRAFRLLETQDPAAFQVLEAEVWERWAPALLHVIEHDEDDKAARRALFCKARQYAFGVVLAEFDRIVATEAEEDRLPLPLLDEAAGCFDAAMGELLWERAQLLAPGKRSRRCILDFLLGHEWQPVREWATSRLNGVAAGVEPWAAEELLATSVLIRRGKEEDWRTVAAVQEARPDFGRELWLSLGSDHDLGLFRRFSPSILRELFLWLEREMPWADLPVREPGRIFSPGPLEDLNRLRWGIVEFLVREGSADAVSALAGIVEESVERETLRWRLRDARRSFRTKNFPWPSPAEVLRVLDSRHGARLVRTGRELLAAIAESLDRLQAELYGETPAVRDLWDKLEGERWRPVEEEALSDYVKRFLDRDLGRSGVIVNREVVVKRRFGKTGSPGQRTDIHVNARDPRSDQELTAVIEVKGCWRPEVFTAMRSQLVGRYLRDKFRHGLYLVVQFNCPQWDPADPRLQGACTESATTELAEELETQSRELSSMGKVYVVAKVLDAGLR